MKQTTYSIVIGFGTIIAIGITIALYRMLTSHAAITAFTVIIIALCVAVCIAILIGMSYCIIRLTHMRNTNKVELQAKQIALDMLTTKANNLSGPVIHTLYLAVLQSNFLPKVDIKELENNTQIPVQYEILEDKKEV